MKLNENQESIYNGLKNIGGEISGFYLGGLKIIADKTIPSRSYLIAHSAREIDGGIRDILAPEVEKKKMQESLPLEGKLKKRRGHIASILVALDLPIDDPFAKAYIDVSTKFVEFVHRRGASRTPRSSEDIMLLWDRYESILIKLVGSYLNQLKQIERIIKFEKPTDEIFGTIENIFSDKQKELYFYNNLKKVNWLEPLYTKGFFSPEYITDESYWNQSEYLEFIASEINEGNVDESYANILIKIIEEISQYSINIRRLDNYRIWYTLLKLLTDLPKDFITDNIIDYFPIYLKTKHENILQSDQIVKFIFSYFGNEEIAVRHKDKIEKTLKLIFEISEYEIFRDESTHETGKYYPVIRSYRLKEASENKVFCSSIAKFCSNDVIFYVSENLFTHLKSELSSEFWIKSIFHLDEVDKHSYSIETIFSTFLKNVCPLISLQSDKRIKEIIRSFMSLKYNHKHFTKLSLYLLAKTWINSKEVFFEFVQNQDEQMLFSNSFWSDDLYFMLEEIADDLNEKEAFIIEKIIENGSQNEEYYNKNEYLNEYKILWYSALQSNEIFKTKYEKLSKKLNRTKDQIKPKVRHHITWGSISPLSKEKLSRMSTKELVKTLKTFDPERSFRSPSVEGLSSNLNTVIKEDPKLFFNNCDLFLEVPYRYISEIFFALYDAWNADINLDWHNILNFIYQYVSQSKFGSDQLQLKNAPYSYGHLSVIRSFCRLLNGGIRKDEKAFDKNLLPLAEKIIFFLLNNYLLFELEDKHKGKLGSANLVINTTTGVVIGSLFDLSLRKARLKNNDIEDKSPRWTTTEKEAYEELIMNNVQEFYMYLGWHRRQFYFLDYEWTNKQLESIVLKDIQTIKSFFGCYLLEHPGSEFEYKTFKEIYIKAIKENWEVEDKNMGGSSIETHATIFYIFNYENFNEGEILSIIYEQKDIKRINNVIHSLSFKFDKYLEELNEDDKLIFKQKLFKIWNKTLDALEGNTKVESKNLPALFHLMKFVDELNQETHKLIIKTSRFVRHGRDFDELIKNLNRLKLIGDVKQSCLYACQIFIESVFGNSYYASIMQKEITEFIEFVFVQKDIQLTNYANKICNEFAKSGQYFLRDLYEKYN